MDGLDFIELHLTLYIQIKRTSAAHNVNLHGILDYFLHIQMMTPGIVPRFFSFNQFRSLTVKSLLVTTRIPHLSHIMAPRAMMSTNLRSSNGPLTVGTMLQSDLGWMYEVEQILSSNGNTPLSVYRARCVLLASEELTSIDLVGSAAGSRYIIKDMIPGEFEHQPNLQQSFSSQPNVRSVVDTIRACDLLIYTFLEGDLLRLPQRSLSQTTRKYILREALRRLVDIHDQDIVHNGKHYTPSANRHRHQTQ